MTFIYRNIKQFGVQILKHMIDPFAFMHITFKILGETLSNITIK
jgi:hypothetical protein